jgi:hypothetical protein
MSSFIYSRVRFLLSCNFVFIRSRGIPVVTIDHPAKFPAVNSIRRSYIVLHKCL